MAKVVFVTGDDVSTDVIYPGRYMATVLPTETPQFAFADDKNFNAKLVGKTVPPGSIIVGGWNFGCGSSREQAVSALKGHAVVIVAKSFARIFLQNSINLGLQTIVCPEIEATVGNEMSISPDKVWNVTSGKKYAVTPLPAARQAIIDAGGLIAYTRKRVMGSTRMKKS
jgi:3-isopropylmalate/(R)-2-methylmalate dehydratase small subunit